MLDKIIRIDRGIAVVETALCIILLCGIVTVTAAGVFLRYVMNSPLVWGADAGMLSMVWLTFIGSSVLFRKHGHLAASSLPDMLPPAGEAALRGLAQVIVAVSIAVSGWFALQAAQVQNGQMITTLDVPRSLYSVPIVWMSVSMLLAIALRLVFLARGGAFAMKEG